MPLFIYLFWLIYILTLFCSIYDFILKSDFYLLFFIFVDTTVGISLNWILPVLFVIISPIWQCLANLHSVYPHCSIDHCMFSLSFLSSCNWQWHSWNETSKYIQLCFLKAVPSLRKNSIEQKFGVQGWMPGGLQMMFLCISNQRWLSLLFLMLQKGWKFSPISLALLISASQSLPVRFIPYFWWFIFQIHSLVLLIL